MRQNARSIHISITITSSMMRDIRHSELQRPIMPWSSRSNFRTFAVMVAAFRAAPMVRVERRQVLANILIESRFNEEGFTTDRDLSSIDSRRGD